MKEGGREVAGREGDINKGVRKGGMGGREGGSEEGRNGRNTTQTSFVHNMQRLATMSPNLNAHCSYQLT